MRPLGVAAVGLVGLVAGLIGLVAPVGAPAASAAAGTSCRAVSGAPVASAGPQRATVVVDTGSGAPWSACISFAGTISGIDALELAKAQIPGLAPVYDIYAGEGRAVCRLRGVGNDPPDCLGKTIEYWGYFHNGRYASAGAGAVTVRDGDVEAWRWGASSATPRRATEGYEAAAAVAPPSTTPTTRPAQPPTTAPPAASGGTASAGSTSGSSTGQPTIPPGSLSSTTTADAGAATTTTTVLAASGEDGLPTTTATTSPAGSGDGARVASRGLDRGEQAAAPPGSPGGPSLDSGDDGSGAGSSAGSIAAFAAAMAAVGGVGLVVRRRRAVPA